MGEENERPGYHKIIRKNADGEIVSVTWIPNQPHQEDQPTSSWRSEEKKRRETGGRQSQSEQWRKGIGKGQRRHTRTSLFKKKE